MSTTARVSRNGITLPMEQIVEFCRRWKIRQLAVFGSFLRDDFRPDSDLDFLYTFAADVHWTLFDLLVRIISNRRLREDWESRGTDSRIAERDLSVWRKLTENADWTNFGALRQTFQSADLVGNCVVFDVGNNRYRLIGRVNYARGIVYVLKVMDHAEYDKGRWIDDCGCHEPPPKRQKGK